MGHKSRGLFHVISERDCVRQQGSLTVLEGAEPQQNKMQTVLSSSKNDFIKYVKIESSLLGFDHFPGYTPEDRIDVCVSQLLPYRVHVIRISQGGVLKLSGQHQEGLSIDHQLLRRRRRDEVGDLFDGHLVVLRWVKLSKKRRELMKDQSSTTSNVCA